MERKATGITRPIDDLGRIVIPKEIRRNMNLREGDAMEFYIEDGKYIIMAPYSSIHSTLTNNKGMFLAAMKSANLNAKLYLVSPYGQWDTKPDAETDRLAHPILEHLRKSDDAPTKFIQAGSQNSTHLTIVPLYHPDETYLGAIVVRPACNDDPTRMDAFLNMLRSICVWELEKGLRP